MKILNLFAGIGGNRTLWGDEHEITAVEIDPKIAEIYKKRFPNDKVIIGDAYDYFMNNFEFYDKLWASVPCKSHSILNHTMVGHRYKGRDRLTSLPDLRLYSLIIFCIHMFRGEWVIENVKPYYDPLINPTSIRGRHYYWSNFPIPNTTNTIDLLDNIGYYESIEKIKIFAAKRDINIEIFGNLDKRKIVDILRNMVSKEDGKLIFDQMISPKQRAISTYF